MAYGDGTIFEFTDSRSGKTFWMAKIYIDGKAKTCRFDHSRDGKKAAAEWLRSARRDKEDGIRLTDQTLRQAVEKYIRTNDMARLKKEKIKRPTFSRTLSTIKSIPTWLMDMSVSEIKKDDLNMALNQLGERMSSNGVNKARSILKRVLDNEVENDRLRKNPMNTIQRERHSSSEDVEIYSRQELWRMYRAAHYIQSSGTYHSIIHDYGLLFAILLTTGMRIGEVLSLQWEYVDLTTGQETIRVRYTLDSHWYKNADQKSLILNTPKTKSSIRDIPLQSPHVIRKLKAIECQRENHQFLFETRDGTPISYQNFFRRWDSICREAAHRCPHCGTVRPNHWKCECGNTVTRRRVKCNACGAKRPTEWSCPVCGNTVKEIHKKPHTTRHTYISYMIARGTPIASVSKVVGHSSPQVTLDVYTHVTHGYMDELRTLYRGNIKNPLK